jgi:hypothetical protein
MVVKGRGGRNYDYIFISLSINNLDNLTKIKPLVVEEKEKLNKYLLSINKQCSSNHKNHKELNNK